MFLTEDYIKKLMNIGAERNILVYDADAYTGVPTTKLIVMMKLVAKLNHPTKNANCINSIIVDEEFESRFICDPNSLIYIRDKISEETNTLHGLKVYLYDYEEFTNLTKNYLNKELGGVLQFSDEKLIIMFNDSEEPTLDNVLLGSY